MRFKTSWLAVLMTSALFASPVRADDPAPTQDTSSASDTAPDSSPQLEVIDIPTADVLDPMTYTAMFRFYDEGGLVSRFILGPVKRVNLGISFDAQHMVGSGDPHMIEPSLFFKVKPIDGNDIFPAIALGYDNQGMLWQESTDQFMHREKGLYLVGSHAIFLPNFDLHAGVNIYEFDEDAAVFGFFGGSLKFTQNFALLIEYDNIRNGRDNRFNVGGRFWIAPYFNIDFAARNIPHGGERGAERILRLNYLGHFPI